MTTNPKIIHEKTSTHEQQQNRRQLRMGPAPFASFEDLSDEVRSQRVESPEDKQAHLIRLPGIHEDFATTPGGSSINEISDNDEDDEVVRQRSGISLIGGAVAVSSILSTDHYSGTFASMLTTSAGAKLTPCTPRIDISRASSSSHHEDSKDSTPENQDAITALGVGFREEGALELRSSTEELDFQDTTTASGLQKSMNKSRPTSPLIFICDPNFDRQRKDSQTSEICLLSISGRTSRLSSVGSQCSDHSRISTASHLSVMSGQSGASRSTSPHKMLLETSFCGSRANLTEISQSTEQKDGGDDALEKVLLARKHDPREAILGEGITIETKSINNKTSNGSSNSCGGSKKPKSSSIPTKPARTSITMASSSKVASQTLVSMSNSREIVVQQTPTPTMTIPTISIADSNQTAYEAKYVTPKGEKLIPGQTIKTQTGTEFTFIPLKGPLPKDFNKPNSVPLQRKRSASSSSSPGARVVSSAETSDRKSSANTLLGGRSKSTLGATTTYHHHPKDPEYIRIKLKPDYMYDGGDDAKKKSEGIQNISAEKPKTLNLTHKQLNKITVLPTKSSVQQVSSSSPLSSTQQTPPTSLSRKSSLFRSRETISPADCSTTPTPTSTSVVPGGGKQRKSVFTTKLKETDDQSSRSKSRERGVSTGSTNEWSLSSPAATTTTMSSNESIDGLNKKQKSSSSSVFSIFKPKKTPTTKSTMKMSNEHLNSQYETGITNVEFTFDTSTTTTTPTINTSSGRAPGGGKLKKYHEQLLDGDSIRIPLHSPSEYENRTILNNNAATTTIENHVEIVENVVKVIENDEKKELKEEIINIIEQMDTEITKSLQNQQQASLSTTNSEDSSTAVITVIESTPVTSMTEQRRRSLKQHHHTSSSTSSENVVFTTKLGSNEEIFTTKLPKKLSEKTEETTAVLIENEKQIITIPSPPKEDVKKEIHQVVQVKEIITPKIPTKVGKSKTKSEKIKVSQQKVSVESIKSPSPSSSSKVEEKLQLSIDKAAVSTPPALSDISNRNSIVSTTANEETSENSENDSEIEFINKKTSSVVKKEKVEELTVEDHERKTLVFQTDSFDDELPYVPTTLPLERSCAIPIVPIKQRTTFEMKTRPIERPRSTTPINPSTIDDYCGENTLSRRKNAEKLRISLPREDTIEKIQKLKSPRKGTTNPKAWQEFAEKGIVSTTSSSHQSSTPSSAGSCGHYAPDSGDEIVVPPPPLPPRSAPKEQTKQWINFEEIPEKHKPPKRIQTIPSRSHIDVQPPPPPSSISSDGVLSSGGAPGGTAETVIYNYVNPEDCQCECHEAGVTTTTASSTVIKPPAIPSEEIEPLLQDDDSSDDTMKQSSSTSSSHLTMTTKNR